MGKILKTMEDIKFFIKALILSTFFWLGVWLQLMYL